MKAASALRSAAFAALRRGLRSMGRAEALGEGWAAAVQGAWLEVDGPPHSIGLGGGPGGRGEPGSDSEPGGGDGVNTPMERNCFPGWFLISLTSVETDRRDYDQPICQT